MKQSARILAMRLDRAPCRSRPRSPCLAEVTALERIRKPRNEFVAWLDINSELEEVDLLDIRFLIARSSKLSEYHEEMNQSVKCTSDMQWGFKDHLMSHYLQIPVCMCLGHGMPSLTSSDAGVLDVIYLWGRWAILFGRVRQYFVGYKQGVDCYCPDLR